MNKKAKIFIALGASLTALSLAATSAASLITSADEGVSIPSTVHVGDTVSLSNHKITYEGETKPATEAVVTTPGGSKFESETLTIDENGVYSVEFSAYFGDIKVTETVEIKSIYTPKDIFEVSGKATLTNEAFDHSMRDYDTYKGVHASMKAGSVLTLKKAIDFNNVTKDDALFDFVVDPSTAGSADFDNLYVRFTDVDDPTNYITIRYLNGYGPSGGGTRICYVTAAAADQYYGGYEEWTNIWYINSSSGYGSDIDLPFMGLSESDEAISPYLNSVLTIDYPKRSLYVSHQCQSGGSGILNDLDHPARYASNPWNGFTNGKAIMSIYATDITGSSADILIKGVYGFDLSGDELIDETSPTIDIDFDGEDENDLPRAKVGKTYPVYASSVSDDFADGLSADVKVTYYDETNDRNIDVYTDGKTFRTDYPGKYTVTYTARDTFSNVTSRSYDIYAVSSISNIKISAPSIGGEYHAYSTVSLPDLSEVSCTGGTGKINVVRKIYFNGNEVEENDNSFYATEPGSYIVRYYATDRIGNSASADTVVNVLTITEPKFTGSVLMPERLLKGFTYDLPTTQVVYPDGDKIGIGHIDSYINGVKCEDSSFTVTEDTAYSFVFVPAPQDDDVNAVTMTIPVIDPKGSGEIDRTKYFYSDYPMTVSEQPEGTYLKSSRRMSFANALSSSGFSFSFRYSKNDAVRSGYVYVTLTDAEDMNKSVTFKIVYESGAFNIQYPNMSTTTQFSYQLAKTMLENDTYVMSLSYDKYNMSAKDISGTIIGQIPYFDDGSVFTGFSGRVYCSFGTTVTDASICLSKLNNQGFYSDLPGDTAGPEIVLDSEFDKLQEYGSKLTLSKGSCYDVLSPVDQERFTLTVTDPNGENIFNKVSPDTDRELSLDMYGNYSIVYKASDSEDISSRLEKGISVMEKEKPTLTVKNTLKSSYSVNDSVSIPEYEMSDNSGTVKADIYLILPDNQIKMIYHEEKYPNEKLNKKVSYLDKEHFDASFIVDETTFRVLEEGTYRMRFYVYDAYGNHVQQEYSFDVAE